MKSPCWITRDNALEDLGSTLTSLTSLTSHLLDADCSYPSIAWQNKVFFWSNQILTYMNVYNKTIFRFVFKIHSMIWSFALQWSNTWKPNKAHSNMAMGQNLNGSGVSPGDQHQWPLSLITGPTGLLIRCLHSSLHDIWWPFIAAYLFVVVLYPFHVALEVQTIWFSLFLCLYGVSPLLAFLM